MKKFIKNLAFGVGWSMLLLIGCAKDEASIYEAENSTEPLLNKQPTLEKTELLQDLLAHGFPEKDIVDYGELYLVQGDMAFHKSKDYFTIPNNQKTEYIKAHTKDGQNSMDYEAQYRFPSIILNAGTRTFKVWRSPDLDANWRAAVPTAMTRWSDACALTFNLTTNEAAADIKVVPSTELDIAVRGMADEPSGGDPGKFIWVNINYNFYSLAQKEHLITHELGHAIGFAHTNAPGSVGIPIPNTPPDDDDSVMNLGIAGSTISLSSWDRYAANVLYPRPELNPNSINLSSNPLQAVNITGLGHVTVRLSGDPGLILYHGSSSGTSLNLTAPTTFEVHKQWGSGYSRIMLDEGGSNLDIAFVSF